MIKKITVVNLAYAFEYVVYLLMYLLLIYFGNFCSIDVKGHVTGYGSADWKRTHEAAGKTASLVTALLKNGATCVGKTVMDELGFGYIHILFPFSEMSII